jgi:cell division protein FtsB
MMLQTIETVIGHWVTIIKAHEKLLIVAITALTLLHFGDKAYDAYGKHLVAQQSATNAQITQLEKNNAEIATKLAELKASVDAQAKVDDAKIAAAKKTIIVQQQADAALPLPDLSKRWEDMLKLSPGSILPQSNGTVAVTTDAAHSTVNELEKVGPLQDQLVATQDKFNGCTQVRSQQETQIAGLNSDIALEKKGRAEDAKVAKHNEHKAWMKGFKWGAVVGFVGGVVTLHKF